MGQEEASSALKAFANGFDEYLIWDEDFLSG